MSWNQSEIVFAVHDALREIGIRATRGHLFEVFASLLGFRTYAAYRAASQRGADHEGGIENAEIICLRSDLALRRLDSLGIAREEAKDVLKQFIDVINDTRRGHFTTAGLTPALRSDCRIYATPEDFIEDESSNHLDARLFESDEINSIVAETNGYLENLETHELIEMQSFPGLHGIWQLQGQGVITCTHDEERPYSGHEIEFTLQSSYLVVGSVGLIHSDDVLSASVIREFEDS